MSSLSEQERFLDGNNSQGWVVKKGEESVLLYDLMETDDPISRVASPKGPPSWFLRSLNPLAHDRWTCRRVPCFYSLSFYLSIYISIYIFLFGYSSKSRRSLLQGPRLQVCAYDWCSISCLDQNRVITRSELMCPNGYMGHWGADFSSFSSFLVSPSCV